jgi:hypothetical protein
MLKPFLIAAFALGSAGAAPMYYTFSGKVGLLVEDKGGYAAAHDIKGGTAVDYVFEVDTARLGFFLDKSAKTEMADSIDEGRGYRADYFFDSLVTPSLFSAAVTDDASGEFMGYHTATKLGTSMRYSAALQTIIGDNAKQTQVLLYLMNSGETEFLPKLNDVISGTESYNDGATATSSVSLNLKCTGISATKPSAIRPLARTLSRRADAHLSGSLLIDPGARVFLASGRRWDK